jgi:hypothetical protein
LQEFPLAQNLTSREERALSQEADFLFLLLFARQTIAREIRGLNKESIEFCRNVGGFVLLTCSVTL